MLSCKYVCTIHGSPNRGSTIQWSMIIDIVTGISAPCYFTLSGLTLFMDVSLIKPKDSFKPTDQDSFLFNAAGQET